MDCRTTKVTKDTKHNSAKLFCYLRAFRGLMVKNSLKYHWGNPDPDMLGVGIAIGIGIETGWHIRSRYRFRTRYRFR